MARRAKFAQPFPDFEIIDRLGSGAMGTVFKARRRENGELVALKVLRPSLGRNSRYVERLKREAELSERLDHESIIRGFGLGEEAGYHYLVMEFCEGDSLKLLLRAWGSFPEERVLAVGVQIARALAHAHSHGIVHRDVKPGNIIVNEDGLAKLTDLGLAKGERDLTLTSDGATVGTPQYMSPEQATDPSNVDERSDLYSLGATLYHMSTGSPPFDGSSVGNVILKLLRQRVRPA
ncbi:MAG: serine/threonine-protein kinase, partial [Planctomycetota bacterium]